VLGPVLCLEWCREDSHEPIQADVGFQRQRDRLLGQGDVDREQGLNLVPISLAGLIALRDTVIIQSLGLDLGHGESVGSGSGLLERESQYQKRNIPSALVSDS
jgi:hypothetical protein